MHLFSNFIDKQQKYNFSKITLYNHKYVRMIMVCKNK